MGMSLAAKEGLALENIIYPVQNFYIFGQILFHLNIGKYQKPYNPPTLSTKAQDLYSLKVQF